MPPVLHKTSHFKMPFPTAGCQAGIGSILTHPEILENLGALRHCLGRGTKSHDLTCHHGSDIANTGLYVKDGTGAEPSSLALPNIHKILMQWSRVHQTAMVLHCHTAKIILSCLTFALLSDSWLM